MKQVIPSEHTQNLSACDYESFVLAGKAHFTAICELTNHKFFFFVRKRKGTTNMYNVYVWDGAWQHIAFYNSSTHILQVYTANTQHRNALKAIFAFHAAPEWLTLQHQNCCPRCGRVLTKNIHGFGEKCWKKTLKELKKIERN